MCKYYAHMAKRFNTPEAARALGMRLRTARHEAGMTLESVGKATGINHGQLSRIERGKAKTMAPNVQKMCDFLDVPIDIAVQLAAAARPGERVDALVRAIPDAEPLIARMLDALEELIGRPPTH
jgi:transcriptional regulator with XRE-family HTH domain